MTAVPAAREPVGAVAPAGRASPWARALAFALAFGELAGLLLCLAYAVLFWVRLPGQLPSEQDYLSLREALARDAQPGDAAAVLPFWAERAKLYLRGLPVLALPNLEVEPDAERSARLWVIAQPDLPRSSARATLKALGRRLTAVGAPRHFGPLELWLFVPKAGRAASYDFIAHAAEAQIQAPVPLRLEWREFAFLPRRCLVVRGGPAILRFSNVSVQHGLRVALGALGPGPGAGARLQASIDGRALPPFDLVEGGAAFQSAELVAEGLSPGAHEVELTVTGRNLCADAVAF